MLFLVLILWGPPVLVAAIGAYLGGNDRKATARDVLLAGWPGGIAVVLVVGWPEVYVENLPHALLHAIPWAALAGSLVIVAASPRFRGTALCWQGLGWCLVGPAYLTAALNASGSWP